MLTNDRIAARDCVRAGTVRVQLGRIAPPSVTTPSATTVPDIRVPGRAQQLAFAIQQSRPRNVVVRAVGEDVVVAELGRQRGAGSVRIAPSCIGASCATEASLIGYQQAAVVAACTDGSRMPVTVFWTQNVVAFQSAGLLRCPGGRRSEALTKRVLAALTALNTTPVTTASQPPPSVQQGIACATSPRTPTVVPSTGTPLEAYSADPRYENVQLVPIGTSRPRPGIPPAGSFLQAWCAAVTTGATHQQVFARLGRPNIRVGAYSVWEVGRTRYFVEFDRLGAVAAWYSSD